ncbi:MAG: hypothetical protein ACWGQW_23735, partial [bacterium]
PFPISIRAEERSFSETEVKDFSASFLSEPELEADEPVDSSLQELWLKTLETEADRPEKSELLNQSESLPIAVREKDPYSPPAEPKKSSLSLEFELEPEEASVVSSFREQWAETSETQEENQQELYSDSEPFPISVRREPSISTQEEPSESVKKQGSTVRIYPVADEPEAETSQPSAEAAAPISAVTAGKESESDKPSKRKPSRPRSRRKGKRRRRRR